VAERALRLWSSRATTLDGQFKAAMGLTTYVMVVFAKASRIREDVVHCPVTAR
jgi:hypothetical protein